MSSTTPKNPPAASRLQSWAENAQPGDVRVYAKSRTGFADASADKVAAWNLHLAGAVILTQRREADRSISYLATRSRF